MYQRLFFFLNNNNNVFWLCTTKTSVATVAVVAISVQVRVVIAKGRRTLAGADGDDMAGSPEVPRLGSGVCQVAHRQHAVGAGDAGGGAL